MCSVCVGENHPFLPHTWISLHAAIPPVASAGSQGSTTGLAERLACSHGRSYPRLQVHAMAEHSADVYCLATNKNIRLLAYRLAWLECYM